MKQLIDGLFLFWFHLHPVSKFLVVVIYNVKSLDEVLIDSDTFFIGILQK